MIVGKYKSCPEGVVCHRQHGSGRLLSGDSNAPKRCGPPPKSFQTRRVNNSGDISWHKGRVFVSEVLRNEEIGLEQMDEEVHRVVFHNTELGEFNSAEMRFRAVTRA